MGKSRIKAGTRKLALAVLLWLGIGSVVAAAPSAPEHPGAGVLEGRIVAISGDWGSLQAFDLKSRKAVSLTVGPENLGLRSKLKSFAPGDVVVLEATAPTSGGGLRLEDLSPKSTPIGRETRVITLFVFAAALVIFTAIVLGGSPFKLIVGQDNRYSNSKFQIALWFGTLIVSYVATCWLRWRAGGCDFVGGVEIPRNLFLLSGVSALTLGAAKGITTGKDDAAREARRRGQIAVAKEAADPGSARLFYDLLHNDSGAVDVGDFQMVVITLLAVGAYLAAVYCFLGNVELLKTVTLPDVDTTILAAFGLGHGAYLTKKYAGRPGEA